MGYMYFIVKALVFPLGTLFMHAIDTILVHCICTSIPGSGIYTHSSILGSRATDIEELQRAVPSIRYAGTVILHHGRSYYYVINELAPCRVIFRAQV